MKKIVLASKSPRRIELLKSIGLKFTIDPSDFEEKDTHLSPEELVMHNALGKAQSKAKNHKNAIIIGVDTVGAVDEHILNKPKNKKDAERILKLLSGSRHKVVSGICIIDTETQKALTEVETTIVEMGKMSQKDIENYINSREGEDKAASYAIQGKGALFVKRIEGDYFNVVGMPIFRLCQMLKEFNLEITI